MGVFNPTVRSDEELERDLEYVENTLQGSPAQARFKAAIFAEKTYRNNPTDENAQLRAELLKQCGLEERATPDPSGRTIWGPPPHPMAGRTA